MQDNLVRCGACGNVISADMLTEEFAGACPWCMAGLSLPERKSGRRPTAVEELSPRAGPLPCDDPVAEMPPEAREAPDTARFGRFIRVSLLGKGGMGEVWKAWDPALGRWVALKFLMMTDDRDLAWFQREAHVAATLSHPHIAAIHDIGEDRGLNYIAMQYVEGRTLEKMGSVDPRRAASLLRDAARAVAHAHAEGIIHRDLKPANFMVNGAGHLFVMDFGLARRIDSPSPYSIPGEAAGTPGYMSPAQARGEAVDARADVYSLGATMYELIAGRPPIEGVSIHELLRKATDSAIRPLAEAAPGAPSELVSIVTKCLSRDPDARYATAGGLADDLDRWLAGRPVAAHSAGVVYRARKFAARQIAAVTALAAGLAIAAVFGAGYLKESRQDAAFAEAMTKGQSAWEEVVRYTSGASMPELAAKKAADARSHFEAALAVRDRAPAHLMRGRCLQIEGKIEEAMASWGRAQELDDARFEQAKALILKYQTRRGKPGAHIGRSQNDPGGGTKVTVARDPRPEKPEHKVLREQAEKLLAGVDGATHKSKLLKGMLAVSTYDFETGAKLLAEYTALQPWDAQAMRLEATAWYYINRPKEALAAVNRALERTQDAPSYALLGKVRLGADDDDGAADAYAMAIKLDPTVPEYYLDRCFPNWRRGNYVEMEADATRAIELDPKSVPGHHSRLNARQAQGNLEGAVADVDRIIELQPDASAGYNARGLIKLKKKDFDGAIADLAKSMERSGSNKGAYRNALEWRSEARRRKSDALRDAGRAEEAKAVLLECIADLRKVLELDPDDVFGQVELGESLREAGEAEEGAALLKRAIERNPQVAANWFGRKALTGYFERKWEEAAGLFGRALEIDPLRPGHRPLYAWVARMKAGDGAGAASELARKVPLEDWSARVAEFLAGRVGEEEFLKSAVIADAKTTKERRCEAFYFAAEVRHLAGDLAGAKELYRRCLELDLRNFHETRAAKDRLKELDGK